MSTFLKSAAIAALLASVTKPTLDSAEPDPALVMDSAASHSMTDISLKAAAAVQVWCEGGGDGEGSAERLTALMVGIADENKDGELDDDEQEIVGMAFNAAWDYMAGKGVAESDLEALYGDDMEAANAAGDRVCEMLADALPNGEDEAGEDMDAFAFGAEAQGSVFDAVYKKRFAIRAGKKVVVRKRVAGVVRLSAKQKVAIRKMHLKSHGAKAKMRRMKSARIGRAMGIGRR